MNPNLRVLLVLVLSVTVAGADSQTWQDPLSDPRGWQPNQALRDSGAVEALRGEDGLRLIGRDANRDSMLARDFDVDGARALEITIDTRHGLNTGAAVLLFPLDANGQEGAPLSLVSIPGWRSTRWDTHRKTVTLAGNVRRVRIALSVARGEVDFRRFQLRVVEKPTARSRAQPKLHGWGFQVERAPRRRPVWEIESGDMDGDGKAEVITCDVDGVVEVWQPGSLRQLLRLELAVLVYDFALADVTGDGRPELLLTTLDIERPLEAYDLQGKVVRRYQEVRGPRHIVVADMDGDGRVEIGLDKGRSGGDAMLVDTAGQVLWRTDERVGAVAFGDVDPAPGKELVVFYGGPRLTYWLVRGDGNSDRRDLPDTRRIFNFAARAADIDGDGRDELLVLCGTHEPGAVACLDEGRVAWSVSFPPKLQGSLGFLEVGDFHLATPGLETVAGGSHTLMVFDNRGQLLHISATDDTRGGSFLRMWDPDRILIPDLTMEAGKPAALWCASSQLRDNAAYRLTFGRQKPCLRDFPVADRERHLDSLYDLASRTRSRQESTQGRFHVIYTCSMFRRLDRQAIRRLYDFLRQRETPQLEYVLMYDASDVFSHPRGTKLRTEQIIDNARWLEQEGIPFGYFAVHSCEPWLSEQAIRGTLVAAPNSFRFVYAAENLEGFYTGKHLEFLAWCRRMMELLHPRGKLLLLKEKHDAWASIIADPEVRDVLFAPQHQGTLVPLWATNQPFHPETQLGGMLGLKQCGWVREFGMSTQYWNWGEWNLRDVNLAKMTPSDITLRLELLGAALGATWLHIEGGQPYLTRDDPPRLDRMATRHRDLVYELIRKGLLPPAPDIVNINHTAIVVHHNGRGYQRLRENHGSLKNFKAGAPPGPLRSGFLPRRIVFEPWPPDAFAVIAYDQRWHVESCFPSTPHGWHLFLPNGAPLPDGFTALHTDEDRVWLPGMPTTTVSGKDLQRALLSGGESIPVEAPDVCMVVHRRSGEGAYRLVLIDPGYLSPTGLTVTLTATHRRLISCRDALSDEALTVGASGCPVSIPRGAFRIIEVATRP